MRIKILVAFLILGLLLCLVFTSCSGDDTKNSEPSTTNSSKNNVGTQSSDTTISTPDGSVNDKNDSDTTSSSNSQTGGDTNNSDSTTNSSNNDNSSSETNGSNTDTPNDDNNENNDSVKTEVVDGETGNVFMLSQDGEYYVFTGYDLSKCEDRIIVPSEYDGKPVKAIGDSVFEGLSKKVDAVKLSNFYRILVPESIEQIGKKAFTQCESIKVVLYRNQGGKITEILDRADIYDWVVKVTIEEENNNLIDVIGQMRPAFGWSIFSGATYYVRLNANGGSVVGQNGEVIKELSLKNKNYSLPIPTKEGCEFDGWYYGDTKIENEGSSWRYRYIELTARWK